jgi:hypothetical protein
MSIKTETDTIEKTEEDKKPEKELSRGERTRNDITALLRARNTLLWIVSREEVRVENSLIEAAARAKFEVRLWDCAAGIVSTPDKENKRKKLLADGDPTACIKFIADKKDKAVYVLRDLHLWIRDPMLLRQLRNLAKELESAEKEEARAIIVLSPSSEIPPELAGHATVLDYPLPDRIEIAGIVDNLIENVKPELKDKALAAGRDSIIDSAVGLTAQEASNCFSLSLVVNKTLSPSTIGNEKKRIIAREKVLTWVDPDPRGLEAIGGLKFVKEWLIQRKAAFSAAAKAYGLPTPKALLLCGCPGTGKSLTAKCVATAWQMPLLRLDFGALKSKYVGDSEQNVRRALSVAETVAPCVMWIDELEKGLAGSTGPQGDGGVSADALSVFLSWSQDKQGSVFTLATANAVDTLPPELLRRGRFDEMFFLDLPTLTERKEVLIATLRQFNRDPSTIDIDRVAKSTDMFTGAEIASLLPDALFDAFSDNARPLKTEDLLVAAGKVVPMAKTSEDKIKRLREWAKTRARRASPPEDETNSKGGRMAGLDLDDPDVN